MSCFEKISANKSLCESNVRINFHEYRSTVLMIWLKSAAFMKITQSYDCFIDIISTFEDKISIVAIFARRNINISCF